MVFIRATGSKEFRHIFHEHPLAMGRHSNPKRCNGCGEDIQDLCYSCRDCYDFDLHESCFEIPHELQHPIHDKHRLILHKTAPYYNGICICDFCGELWKWFVYHCPECQFDIHFKCAFLPLTVEAEIHDHPFTIFRKLIAFTCDICGKNDKNIPYLCGNINCGLWVHRNCASLPRMVKHIRHKHSLNFTNSIKSNDFKHQLCQLCVKKVGTKCGVYYCSICDYVTHLDCATDEKGRDETFMQKSKDKEPIESTTPVKYEDWELDKFTNKLSYVVKSTKVGEDKIEIPIQINHFSHEEHDLKLFNKLENHKICNGCIRPIFPPFYSCAQCNFFIHKSCAKLPSKIQHPLHQHLLTLQLKRYGIFWCDACSCYSNGFSYKCEKCSTYQFQLDISCSLISDGLTHVGHKHPLILSNSTNAEKCSACNSKGRIFLCTECEFTLDFRCVTLPCTIKCRQHEHPFTLNYIVEDDSGEYYCDICEEERDPRDWFYYYEKCNYPAHTKCIFGESSNDWFGDFRNFKLGTTRRYANHQHPLTYIHKSENHLPCSKCGKPCNELALECAIYNLIVHVSCLV